MDPNTAGTPTLPSAVKSPRAYMLSGKLMLSGIVVLFGIVLLILFVHLYVRWHVIRRYNGQRRRRQLLVFTAEDPTTLSSSTSPTPPRGLDKDVLSTIPIEIFSEEEDVAPPECAVCLNEFVDGEKVRALPMCGHRFHIDCIDMWFFSHSTCPLCRCAVEAVTSPAPENPSVSVSDPSPPEPVSDPEVRIEVLAEEPESTSGQAVKLPGHRRISSIRRFLSLDPRLNRGGEPDLERGESADRPHSPARPTTPSAE